MHILQRKYIVSIIFSTQQPQNSVICREDQRQLTGSSRALEAITHIIIIIKQENNEWRIVKD